MSGESALDLAARRLEQAVTRTYGRRPDLIARGELAPEASRLLSEFLAARAPGTEDRG